MIVLGYLSSTSGNSVEVPPFHTGHLGLIPGTQVNLYLMTPNQEVPSNCEVLVTPIQRIPDNLMQITCVMKDEPGVVSHLIKAIYSLGINILSEESSAINHLNHHFVNLLIDWTGSKYPEDTQSLPSIQRRYGEYSNVFPPRSMRCVHLFDSIMAFCGDVIVFDMVNNNSVVPQLSFRSLRIPKQETVIGDTVTKRTGKQNYSVKFDLPDNLIARIRQRVMPENEDIPFLLLSDTEDRTLRVFFPKPELKNAIVHLGFFHNDTPGALAGITALVARSKFNILTSLLRKKDSGKNVWEAVLEYRGKEKLPVILPNESLESRQNKGVEWAGKIFGKVCQTQDVGRLQAFKIVIRSPDYPTVKDSPEVSLDSFLGSEQSVAVQDKPIDELITERLNDIKKSKEAFSLYRERAVQIVKDSVRQQPRVFLSYPKRASEHGDTLKNELIKNTDFLPDEYQLPRGEIIVDEVLKKIESCDYFVGIWHHEDGRDPSVVSPWLPFEYGIALAFGRKCIIVHSNRLDPSIWRRISPNVAHAEYSDVKFQTGTIPIILENLTQFENDRR